MPTLEECSNQIKELVDEKGFNADMLFFKLVWAGIEISEAIDLVKKFGLPEINIKSGFKLDGTGTHWESVPWKIGEEIADTVFYCCDAYRLLKRKYPDLPTMDEMFEYKMNKNMNRPKRYGQKWASSFMKAALDHFHAEGMLNEMMTELLEYAAKKDFKPVPTSGYVTCGLCNGTGKIASESYGTAKVEITCWTCGGSGKVFKWED